MSSYKIVITSINPPTSAIYAFAEESPGHVIMVGDKKTPAGWNCDGVDYLSVEDQMRISDQRFTNLLPFNHYSRKMMGYLYAMRAGVNIIVDTDDDNIPKPDWRAPSAFTGKYFCTPPDAGFINIYRWFADEHIWPRGFPLNLLLPEKSVFSEEQIKESLVDIGVWQGLADKAPDVDAIYRLVIGKDIVFNEKSPIVLDAGTITPFNSQNTAFRREVFPLLYLPSFVTFRFTDILRGLVAQPILWAHGWRLGFHQATVVQERNYHNLMHDFESEIPCYLQVEKVVDIVRGAVSGKGALEDDLLEAYRALYDHAIVVKQEIELLEAWLDELANL